MRLLRSFLLVAMVCAGVASCSSSNTSSSCAPSSPTQTVQLQDFAFSPDCIGAPSGSRLVLQNTGAAKHTFTVQSTAIDQSVDAGAGAEVQLAGIAPGTYHVICTIHPQMTATLVVS